MADGSKIEWTEATWNPVRGCSRISEGCRNCYAEAVAARFSGPGQPYEGLAKMTPAGPRWTGQVAVIEKHMDDPRRWTRPRRVFVNSMSDLFHERLRDEEIDRVFAVMADAPQHTFQVLTKRAIRMRAWAQRAAHLGRSPPANVWMGVSVEDQIAAAERVDLLLDTPAAVRWLSLEPLIGPVVISRTQWSRLDWIVIGGESGHGARPFDLEWARSIIRHARTAERPPAIFVKQLGRVPIVHESIWRDGTERGRLLNAHNKDRAPAGHVPLQMADSKGGDWEHWPADLRIREYPRAA